MEARLKAQLERDEGRKLFAYQDTNGYWTIGVGHLLGAAARMTSITDTECDALLEMDVDIAARNCHTVFNSALLRLDAARTRALLNMMFNRGLKHVVESTTITPAIKAAMAADLDHDIAWKKVSDAILASPWGQQIGARAVRLAKQFETGVDQ